MFQPSPSVRASRRVPKSALFDREYNDAFAMGISKLDSPLPAANPRIIIRKSTTDQSGDSEGYINEASQNDSPIVSLKRDLNPLPPNQATTTKRRSTVGLLTSPIRLVTKEPQTPSASAVRKPSKEILYPPEVPSSPTNLISLFDRAPSADVFTTEEVFALPELSSSQGNVSMTGEEAKFPPSSPARRLSTMKRLSSVGRRMSISSLSNLVGSVTTALSKLTPEPTPDTTPMSSPKTNVIRTTALGAQGFAFMATARDFSRGEDDYARPDSEIHSSPFHSTLRTAANDVLAEFSRNRLSNGSDTVCIFSKPGLEELSMLGSFNKMKL